MTVVLEKKVEAEAEARKLLPAFDPFKNYIDDLKKGEYLEKEGNKLPRLKGLQRLAHQNRGGVLAVDSQIEHTPARDNPIASVTVSYMFNDGTRFDGSADATTKAHKEPYNLHLVAVAESKAEARALRRAFNISVVAAEEIGSAPVVGNVDGPIEDVQIQGIRKVGERKGLETDSLILNTIKSNAGSLNELTAQEGRDAMKTLNKIRKKVQKK